MSKEAAQVAREAADLIEQKGHAKGVWMDADGRYCLWGAIIHVGAQGTDARAVTIRRELTEFFSEKLGLVPQSFAGATSFNDLPETTSEDVQKFLRSAADEIEFL